MSEAIALTMGTEVPQKNLGPWPVPEQGGKWAFLSLWLFTVVKNPPHPNATRVFVNWLLGKEGQELYGKAMLQGTRRLDVDTQWLKESGIEACKDIMTVEDYYRLETHLESSVNKLRKPATALAEKLLSRN